MTRYWNSVTRLEETVTVGSMEALYEGGVRPADYDTRPWMCNECKLVWGRMSQAIECKRRGHRNQYRDTYYWQVQIEGKAHIVEQSYVRAAIKRNGPRPTPAQAPAPALVQETPEVTAQELVHIPTLEQVRFMADALGYRLSRKPQKPQTPEFEVTEPSETPAF